MHKHNLVDKQISNQHAMRNILFLKRWGDIFPKMSMSLKTKKENVSDPD